MLLRPHTEVYEEIVRMSAAAGASCVSQYLCDVLALHAGRTDLVLELNQEVLTLANTGRKGRHHRSAPVPGARCRVPTAESRKETRVSC